MQDAEGRDCSGHGVCDTKVGFCVCDKEWTGKDCSQAAKVDPVALHAKVVSKTLKPVTLPAKTKPEPIVDDEPSTIDPPVSCPNDCSGNGKCNSGGRCECRKGFAGSDCSVNSEERHTQCKADCTAKHGSEVGESAPGKFTACIQECERTA